MDLTEFLLARFAQDEATARNAGTTGWNADVPGAIHARQFGRIKSQHLAIVEHPDVRAHMVRWDPAHVLAECEAKRRVIDLHKAWVDYSGHELFDGSIAYNQPTCSTCDDGHEEHQPYPCPTLRLLALPYADHPSYDEAWRP